MIDIPNLIRAIIFLVAGLVIILFPKQMAEMQQGVLNYVKKKFNINFMHFYTEKDTKQMCRANYITSIIFLIISVILFVVAIN